MNFQGICSLDLGLGRVSNQVSICGQTIYKLSEEENFILFFNREQGLRTAIVQKVQKLNPRFEGIHRTNRNSEKMVNEVYISCAL